MNGGLQWSKSDLSDWCIPQKDQTLDVAVLEVGVPPDWDHRVIPYTLGITEELLSEHEVGLGDEVFITGLFRHHHGARRNIPIVRVGNLACMAEEKVQTSKFGLMDAFLIEARSIGGISGAPVFLNLGVARSIGGKVKHSQSGQPILFLLGLVHGHYDTLDSDVDAVQTDEDDRNQHVNTGIAIVTPVTSVHKVICERENT